MAYLGYDVFDKLDQITLITTPPPRLKAGNAEGFHPPAPPKVQFLDCNKATMKHKFSAEHT